jgi:hypothetical protein
VGNCLASVLLARWDGSFPDAAVATAADPRALALGVADPVTR